MSQTDKVQRAGEVQVNQITKLYAGHAAVSDVSLRANPGEFISLIGPSGSGKTTTLMMIAGFTIPDTGDILLDGKNITRLTPQERQLGMVFQNYAIFPHMTVFENVAFPLRVRRMSSSDIKERVAWALQTVQLDHLKHRYSRELSGGQQQRVALARAIVFHPRIILMDEPLGALDKNLRYHMQVELKDLQRRLGTTVVYVTHDQEEAMNMSDKIAVMNNGEVAQFGAPADLYEAPTSPFVARFLGEANLIPVTVESRTNEHATVALPNGSRLAEVRVSGPGPQSQANMFIRPEKLRLGQPSTASGLTAIDGIITRVSFLGNIVRYALECPGGQEIVVDQQNSRGETRGKVGDHAVATFDHRDALVLAP